MTVRIVPGIAVLLAALFPIETAEAGDENKVEAEQSVHRHAEELIELSDRIWKYAEVALEETRSAAALADYAESQGFSVRRGVADMPTAFTATFGSGKPQNSLQCCSATNRLAWSSAIRTMMRPRSESREFRRMATEGVDRNQTEVEMSDSAGPIRAPIRSSTSGSKPRTRSALVPRIARVSFSG